MALDTLTAETVLQGLRAWLKLAGAAAGLDDEQVIPADDRGPRSGLPYLTLKLLAADVPVGEDEPVVWLADRLTVGVGGTGTVYACTINGTLVSYTRLVGQATSAVATAFAALINATFELVYAEAEGTQVWVAALSGSLAITLPTATLTLVAADLPVAGLMGQRMATVSVQSFGLTAAEWLERAAARLPMPAVQELLEGLGLSVRPLGGMTDLSALLDDHIEGRRLREFEVTFSVRAEPELLIPLETVLVDATFERSSGDPDALVLALEVDAT